MRLSIILILGSLLSIFSCHDKHQLALEEALHQAKDNKSELLKVLSHFSEDSLKLKSAEYLIIQMMENQNHSIVSQRFERFSHELNNVIDHYPKKKKEQDSITYKFVRSVYYDHLWDSLASIYGDPQFYNFQAQSDLKTINSNLLIDNIDYAFKAWELPWNQSYNFDTFCKFILPYRYSNEALTPWRKLYWEELAPIRDSLINAQITNPINAAIAINQYLKHNFWGTRKTLSNINGHQNALNLFYSQLAYNCEDQVGIGFCFMRALGIATSEIVIPNWGNRTTQGHTFNAIFDPDERKWIDFHAGDINPYENKLKPLPKAYLKVPENLNPKDARWIYEDNFNDITAQVSSTVDITLDLPDHISDENLFFLAVFNSATWIPIAISDPIDGSITFKNMGVGMAYLPVYNNENGKLIPFADPILVKNDGSSENLTAYKNVNRKITVKRKFRNDSIKIAERCQDMIGGIFQIANNRNFSDAKTIYAINECTDYLPRKVDLPSESARYVRYIFPPVDRKRKNGPGWIAFIEDSTLHPLSGDYISSEPISNKNLNAIFDENLITYVSLYPTQENIPLDLWEEIPFHGAPDTLWVGMDLGSKKSISSIGYCPRNDKNNIYAGLTYEMFFWDNKWISLGVKKADSHQLEYTVPSNGLYLLKCLSEGKEERIFSINEKGEQVWW